MFDKPLQWLQRNWWGLIVAHLMVIISVYLLIWQFAEPLGIPDSIDNLPDFLKSRVFFHVALTSLLGAYITLVLDLAVRRGEWMGRLGHREYPELGEGDPEGRIVFRHSRAAMPRLGEHLEKAKCEIWMLGVQHTALTHAYLGLLEKKAEGGCEIRILMMAPRDQDGNVNPNVYEAESRRTYTGLLSRLESNTESLRKWLSRLSGTARNRVKIESYLICPVATYLFIDKDEEDGYVQVEVLVPGFDVKDLPHFVIMRRDNEDLLESYVSSFEAIWGDENSRRLYPY